MTARTSSFAFRSKEQDVREIGTRLGAAALLVYNFVKAKLWEREVLYLIVLVPFLLRVFHLK